MFSVEKVEDPTLQNILKSGKNRTITNELCNAIAEFKKAIWRLQNSILVKSIKMFVHLHQL